MATDPETVPAVLRASAAAYGDAEAVVFEGRRLSFAALLDEARCCARAWLAHDVAPGDRVALWAPNTDRWVVAALGALYAGATLVPVNTRLRGAEAAHVLRSSRARALLVDQGFLGTDYLALLAEEELGGLRLVVVPDSAGTAGPTCWSEFLARAAEVPAGRAEQTADAVRPEAISDIVFTSGTTGRAKGAMLRHGQSVRLYRTWSETVGLRAGDRYVIVNPFSHTFGYKAGLLACLLTGATMLPVAVFDVAEVLALLARERVSVAPGPPTLYTSLLDHPARVQHDLTSLRLAVTGGAVVPPALVARMRDELGFSTVLTAYGLTESCGTVTMARRGDPDELVAATSGRAVDGVEVAVVDAASRPLPPGTPGEVVVRGYNVMAGYLDDPAATAAAIDAAGWLHTGDVGVLDTAGNLRVTDRIKDMFVVGGFNAYPAEIERVLVAHPAVSEAAVVGVPDVRLGEVGRAFVVARPGTAVTPAELRAHCREQLANYKVPAGVELVASLPHNATGKVDKQQLRHGWPA